jgi:hypothetical protein
MKLKAGGKVSYGKVFSLTPPQYGYFGVEQSF